MEGGEDCKHACRPDPRSPPLEIGDAVLCASCYQAAIEDLIDDHLQAIDDLKEEFNNAG